MATPTKADFQGAIASEIANFPSAALRYAAKDPVLLASLNAMATMLAMVAAEVDTAAMEPFSKARDTTVYADAAVKGVLPLATPKVVKLNITNAAATAFTVAAGRILQDTQGRNYVVTTGANVPAQGSATVVAEQKTVTSVVHTVTASKKFYRIAVDQPAIGSIAAVGLADASGTEFEPVQDYVNVAVGDLMFHLVTDENRALYIELGAADIVGYQCAAGDKLKVSVTSCEGNFDIKVGTAFAFESSTSLYEKGAAIVLAEVLAIGADPMDVATLREVCSFPSIYDGNAVYLSNFDFLVRRKLNPFVFLSIWNERREEVVRGYNVKNINRLFVAASKSGVAHDALHAQIKAVVLAADDSMAYQAVAVVEVEIPMALTLTVDSVYDAGAVLVAASQLILGAYGRDSAWAKRGGAKIRKKDVYSLLTAADTGIAALQSKNSDIAVAVTFDETKRLPEQFCYISAKSLTITTVEAD